VTRPPRDFVGLEADDDWFERQAQFCLATGVQPSEYAAMTDRQVEVWIRVHNENTKKQNRK